MVHLAQGPGALPDDVEVLARTDVAGQLFRRGRAVGLQFHPEAEHDLVAGWTRLGPDHLPNGLTAGEVLVARRVDEERAHAIGDRLVDRLPATLVPGPPGGGGHAAGAPCVG